MDEDEQIVEQVHRDLLPPCSGAVMCEGQVYSCDRYIRHSGRCVFDDGAGSKMSWWGSNPAPYKGAENFVWKTTGWVRHELLKRDALRLPFSRRLQIWP